MYMQRLFALFKPPVICLMAMLLLLSAGVPAYAAEGEVPANDESPSGIRLSSLETVIDSYMTPARMETTGAVSVAIVKNGNIILNKAYGLADVENNTAADTDTVFEWGSVTKLLVWTSVMQLVEQGKLELQTDIREYLPEGFLKKLKYDEPITLLNLMNHNAGWQEQYTGLYFLQEKDVPDLAEALRIFEPRQAYKPGRVVAYSNYGAALAGYIVELQSGQSFYTYVNEHIFSVLGMEHTSIHPLQQDNLAAGIARDRIQGYSSERELIRQNQLPISIYPAGAALGTTADAAKFMAAIVPPADSTSPLFQSNATLEEMLTPSLMYEGTDMARIAHGFLVNEHAVRTLEHGGNTTAFTSNFVFDPVSEFGMIVMTNQKNEGQFTTGLVDIVFGTYRPETYSGKLPDTTEVAGTYLPARRAVHGFGKMYAYFNTADIVAVNNRTYNWNEQPSSQFAPDAYSKVYWSANEYFVRNDQGEVEKLSIQSSDYFRLTGLALYSVRITLIALVLGITYTLFALINGLLHFSRRTFKRMAGSLPGLEKYHLIINASSLLLVLNIVILAYRNIGLTSYATVRVHLIINILYCLLTAGYIVMLLLKLRRSDSRRVRKVLYVLSGLSAVLFSALIIGWDLYF
ncbi:serine hydrolase domain-containing protein [Paenibacillus camerounensis]|uniref:serine hydrolase domain-containing protein n=1 Tax=Paenibacillus camerounensis TaxID=1243663 RepID=UPI0006939759|nr:serine hydrolase domain-containing protein [Paenibacillus camerounensis]